MKKIYIKLFFKVEMVSHLPLKKLKSYNFSRNFPFYIIEFSEIIHKNWTWLTWIKNAKKKIAHRTPFLVNRLFPWSMACFLSKTAVFLRKRKKKQGKRPFTLKGVRWPIFYFAFFIKVNDVKCWWIITENSGSQG